MNETENENEPSVPPADASVEPEIAPPPGRPTLDDIGEWSFPASDPPASWTWDVDVGRSS